MMSIEGPFQTYKERLDDIWSGLRRLSTAQLRQRYRGIYGNRPRKRLSREGLLRAVMGARIEPGIIISLKARNGPKVYEIVFDILYQKPGINPGEVEEEVRQQCPGSRFSRREVPWYRFQMKRFVRV